MAERHIVEAVLTAKDQGYRRAMEQAASQAESMQGSLDGAQKSSSSFMDTMKGMLAAVGITKALSAAWGMVRDSVGRAFDRLDTMDDFKESMQLMTGDADAAQQAIDRLGDVSRGTAYGLDVMASATQGFVTSSYAIEDSIDYVEGWGNAIAMYGRGTNEQLAGVMEQMTKMAARGKASLYSINSAMNAGIPVIQMYAEVTGQSTEEVSKAVSNGEISAKQFFDTMNQAFSEGTQSFPKLTNAAKNAGDSWSGTFANMRAATTRGMVNIINAIEDGRKRANLPTMKESVANFGRTMERIMTSAGNVLGWVAENAEVLMTAIGGLLASFVGYKTVTAAVDAFKTFSTVVKGAEAIMVSTNALKAAGASTEALYAAAVSTSAGAEGIRAAAKKLGIALDEKDLTLKATGVALTQKETAAILASASSLTVKQIVVGVLTGQIKLATAAQLLWNKVLLANPVVLAVAALAGLLAIFSAIGKAANKLTEEQIALNNAAKDQNRINEDLLSKSRGLKRSYDDSRASIRGAREQGNAYVQSLRNIENSTDSAESKTLKLKSTMTMLERLYPDLRYEIDEVTGSIIGGTDALIDQMNAHDEMAEKRALATYMDELFEDQVQLETQIRNTEQMIEDMLAGGQDKVYSFWSFSGQKDNPEYVQLVERLEELKTQYNDVGGEIEVATDKMNNMTLAEVEASIAADEQARNLEMLAEKYGVTTDAIVDYANKHNQTVEEVANAARDLATKYGLSMDDIILAADSVGMKIDDWGKEFDSTLTDVSSAVQTFADVSLDGLNRLEQQSAISLDKYMENMKANQAAVASWNTNVNKLMNAGVDQGIIATLQKLGPAGAQQAQAWVDELEKLNGGTIGSFDSLNSTTQDKINELTNTYSSGLSDAGDAGLTALKVKDYLNTGEHTVNQVALGIIKGQPYVYKESVRTAAEGARGLSSMAQNFDRSGYNSGLGLASGLSRSTSRVTSSARNLAYEANRAYNRALDIRSPSGKSRWSGQMYGEGIVLGMRDKLRAITDMSKRIALAVNPDPYLADNWSAGFDSGGLASEPYVGQDLTVNMNLGGTSYRMFVKDITSAQAQEAQLVEVFG